MVLLADVLLMWTGFLMVIPLISVHYVDGLGWAAASIGFILGMRQIVQQGLSLIGGALADRLGAKGLICIGMFIRGFGFVGMAWAHSFPTLLLTIVLAALGGALFEAPKAAAIAALTDERNRGRYFALNGTVGGIGTAIGPFVGALLLRIDFALVAIVSGSCFLTAGLLTALLLPAVRVAAGREGIAHGIGLALRDRPFILFSGLLMGFWFMWVQLAISLPLLAKALSGTSDAVSWIYALNAALTIALQYPLLRLAERWLRPLPVLALGVATMAAGLGGVALAGSVPALLACTTLFAVGAILAMPSQQTVAATLANPAARGSYFGVNMLALAFGGGLGNWAGGFLYGAGQRSGVPTLPWLVFATVGLAAATGLVLLHRRLTAAEPARGTDRTGEAVALGGR
ncbi:MAG: Uncharacterized MFS-type transporter [uncultured Thermomicrobiales bacterium]|uniref:Uncharacterized MFS-type transporter n=1 Tax=uncultured Thermomicrobiales bacterium TaxID=1645740 RepID=A0A6J4VUM8_9BACT|nr:MAG: Uncharacterized MFS-type transporter [uncultured Thermomicrobiales bacterium]